MNDHRMQLCEENTVDMLTMCQLLDVLIEAMVALPATDLGTDPCASTICWMSAS